MKPTTKATLGLLVFVCVLLLLVIVSNGQQTPGTLQYPVALDTEQSLFQTTDLANTVTSSVVQPGDTTVNVTSTSSFPETGAIVVNGLEICYYTGTTATSFTGVIRGREGTVASAFQPQVPVEGRMIAAYHRILTDAAVAIETKVGFGVTSSVPFPNALFMGGATAGSSTWGTPTPALMMAWSGTPVTLTDGPTIATDASQANKFRVTLGGNRTLSNPVNAVDGETVTWEVIQDGTGSRTLALGAAFEFGTDVTALNLSTTPNLRDFVTAEYNAVTQRWYVMSVRHGF
ncbi:MAG TPA: hypothetical protein VI756_15405 [Blastocatellia bacterium]